MDPDDNMNFNITVSGDTNVTEDYNVVDISKYTINISDDDTFQWAVDDIDTVKYDNTYSIMPEKDSPSVYTSFEQREQHEKYPALKKAWEDYLNMYNLTQGDPPIVD
jgi:hypothetical protein